MSWNRRFEYRFAGSTKYFDCMESPDGVFSGFLLNHEVTLECTPNQRAWVLTCDELRLLPIMDAYADSVLHAAHDIIRDRVLASTRTVVVEYNGKKLEFTSSKTSMDTYTYSLPSGYELQLELRSTEDDEDPKFRVGVVGSIGIGLYSDTAETVQAAIDEVMKDAVARIREFENELTGLRTVIETLGVANDE